MYIKKMWPDTSLSKKSLGLPSILRFSTTDDAYLHRTRVSLLNDPNQGEDIFRLKQLGLFSTIYSTCIASRNHPGKRSACFAAKAEKSASSIYVTAKSFELRIERP